MHQATCNRYKYHHIQCTLPECRCINWQLRQWLEGRTPPAYVAVGDDSMPPHMPQHLDLISWETCQKYWISSYDTESPQAHTSMFHHYHIKAYSSSINQSINQLNERSIFHVGGHPGYKLPTELLLLIYKCFNSKYDCYLIYCYSSYALI